MATTESAPKTKWSIDQAHSEISFKVRHLMIAHVKGTFKTFNASIYTTGRDFRTAEVDFWIDTFSITTDNVKRDRHLKSRDFFDVKRHKQITFTSGTIAKADQDGNHELWGKLTIMGITQNIKLNIRFEGILNDPRGYERAGFTITGKINRSDWGLIWNAPAESGELLVSDEVAISCEVELTKIGQKSRTIQLEPVLEEEYI
ncbi:MAG: YceI family protein [Bacteroidia bacterium]|nr:YceI family protein [Bacteroidia bacterium]